MRAAAWALIVAAACGAAASDRRAPRLAPPDTLDLRTPGADYLTMVADRLQPRWSEFLTDCRQRLPASHALNQMSLAAMAELVVDPAGHVVVAKIAAPSGNADFDHAVSDVIADASELAVPPHELLADDDRVHLRWLFARDRRQAGPATATFVRVQLPLATVVPRLLRAGEIPRAARRIAGAASGSERTAATRQLMIASLAEALAGADERVRRDALDAVSRARVSEPHRTSAR